MNSAQAASKFPNIRNKKINIKLISYKRYIKSSQNLILLQDESIIEKINLQAMLIADLYVLNFLINFKNVDESTTVYTDKKFMKMN